MVTKPPLVREVTGWICRHPDHLVERDTDRLRALLDRCPELAAAADLVRSFADMPTNLHGDHLGNWITAVQQAALPLILPRSSGPVEGNVNRIKMMKRQRLASSRTQLVAGIAAFDPVKGSVSPVLRRPAQGHGE